MLNTQGGGGDRIPALTLALHSLAEDIRLELGHEMADFAEKAATCLKRGDITQAYVELSGGAKYLPTWLRGRWQQLEDAIEAIDDTYDVVVQHRGRDSRYVARSVSQQEADAAVHRTLQTGLVPGWNVITRPVAQ